MGRLLILMVVLGGCVPSEEWDDDGSGVVFSPTGSTFSDDQWITVVNLSGGAITCELETNAGWSSATVRDGGRWGGRVAGPVAPEWAVMDCGDHGFARWASAQD